MSSTTDKQLKFREFCDVLWAAWNGESGSLWDCLETALKDGADSIATNGGKATITVKIELAAKGKDHDVEAKATIEGKLPNPHVNTNAPTPTQTMAPIPAQTMEAELRTIKNELQRHASQITTLQAQGKFSDMTLYVINCRICGSSTDLSTVSVVYCAECYEKLRLAMDSLSINDIAEALDQCAQ